MRKKGQTPVLWIVVGAALALVVLLFSLSLAGKIPGFGKTAQSTTGGLYKCVCEVPGKGNSCASSNPDADIYVVDGRGNPPADCGGSWDDCNTNCWVKK